MFVHLQAKISMPVALGENMDLLNLKTQVNLMQI